MPRYLFAALLTGLASCAVNSIATLACDHCGHAGACQKVCRLVCENKKVEITCWGCKRENFCVPGPSKPGCQHCETVCDFCNEGCDPNGVHTCPQKFVWTEWIPGCATIRTRKKLMKKVITKEIPSYKWVVEDLCPHCHANAKSASVPAGTEIPQPPNGLGAMMAILPAGILPQSATVSAPSVPFAAPEATNRVLPASFTIPDPIGAGSPASTSGRSWRDSIRLPWQR